jgi:hypothetical protein
MEVKEIDMHTEKTKETNILRDHDERIIIMV